MFGKAPTSPIMQHIEYLLHRRISVDRSILAAVQPQRWVVLVRDFVQYYIQRSVLFGVAPGFYYIRDGMRCVSLPSLNFFVSRNRMWTNTERFMLTNNRKVYNPVNAVMYSMTVMERHLATCDLRYKLASVNSDEIIYVELPVRCPLILGAEQRDSMPLEIRFIYHR